MSNARNLARLLPNASGQLPDAAMASGSVLQVVSGTYNTPTTSSSTSFVTSGFSVSITPTSATSKILILLNGNGPYNAAAGRQLYTTIYRNSTNIGDATYGISRLMSSTDLITPHSINWLDSPATTSSVTYTPYFRSAGGTVNFCYNDCGVLSLTLMEIAA